MRLVDTRWAGIAKGVGTQKILGLLYLMFSCVRSNKHITDSYCSNFLPLSFLCFRKGTHGTDSDRTGISHFKVNSYSIRNFEITFLCSFSILEAQPMDMLLGLDMLKKHQVAYFISRVDMFIEF